MRATRLHRFALSMAAIAMAATAYSHHSPAPYDTSRESVVAGTLTRVFWRNPHVYLTVEVTGADGSVTAQEIEVVSPSSLTAVGVRQQDLQIGELVSVRVNPNRRGAGHDALGLTLTRPNGAVLALRGGVLPPLPVPERASATSLAGNWSPDARPFIALMRTVREERAWPFTDAGHAAVADTATRDAVEANCDPHPIPMIMMGPGVVGIDIAEDRITIDVDSASVQRVINLGVEGPPAGLMPTREGYSVGRWDGDALVVETTAFAPDPKGLGFGLPSSASKHVVERFELGADGLGLEYTATLEDPVYLTEPLNVRSTWVYRPDLQRAGMGCDAQSALRYRVSAQGN